MEIKPQTDPARPSYPTRQQVEATPAWLLKHLPESWRKILAAGGSGVVLLAAGMAGCGEGATSNGGPSANGGSSSASQPTTGPGSPSDPAAGIRGNFRAIVAPIFDHGEGRGAVGCIVISPPVFLTEEDALQVIQDELAKAGVELTAKDVVLPEVAIKSRVEKWDQEGNKLVIHSEETDEANPLSLQAADPNHHVAIQFVGRKNYTAVGGVRSGSTVQRYEFKDRAKFVSQEVRQKSKGLYVGVLYDPMAKLQFPKFTEAERKDRTLTERRWKQAVEASRDVAREDLRKQVRDLAAWLKQQGAV